MAAGRMMAMYVGAGLYTWTSVIGVVLGGITLGNLAGGRIADRFEPRKAAGALFFASAAACLSLPVANYWVGRWMAWEGHSPASFPLRIAIHVTTVFLLPSVSLGLIGPVVAKLALQAGSSTGRTVGNVYAWGALGSIVGTFAAGFFFIALVGTGGIVLGVVVVLAATGLAVSPRTSLRVLAVAWPLLAGLLVASFLVAGRGQGRWIWANDRITIQERSIYNFLYAKESQYSFIRVTENPKGKTRALFMDNLMHAIYSPENSRELLYDYERIYDIITQRQGRSREDLRTFFIGGGGYVFPRHIRDRWPRGSIQVAEIDPAVTEANFAAFGLKREEVLICGAGVAVADPPAGSTPASGSTPGGLGAAVEPRPIHVFHLDARNHVEDLLRLKRTGKGFVPFDFVYGDAFNDYCVPFHLVTREFLEKVRELLRPGSGIYLMNVIDIYDSGLFLGATYNTLKEVFPHVDVFTIAPGGPRTGAYARDTYIVAASLCELDLKDFGTREGEASFSGSRLDEKALSVLLSRSKGVVLTDDYAPVENLLDVVVRRRAQPSSE